MLLNRSALIGLFTINSLCLNAQVQGNNVSQSKSPNANTQIGNGNVNQKTITNKTDNRQYKKEVNNVDNSDNSVINNSLLTAINPYSITINNPVVIDSIKYAFDLKKKEIRIVISDFMFEGWQLKNRCTSDTIFSKLEQDAYIWANRVIIYLSTNLDRSYSTQFNITEMSLPLSINRADKGFDNLWRYVYARIQKLDSFITSLY